ncbi:MAG: hypothetical protein LBL34_05020 [Clostridiales bacterium]|jgi:phage-related protein|nr:hypothetical protein [Clostridiales bacterium]
MDLADATIILDTSFDERGFKKGLGGIKLALKNAGDSLTKAFSTAPIEKTSSAIMKQQNLVDELKQKYEAMLSGESSPKALQTAENELVKIQKEIDKTELTFNKLLASQEAIQAKALDLGGGKQFVSPEDTEELARLDVEMEKTGEKFRSLEAKARGLQDAVKGIKLSPEMTDEAQNLKSKLEVAVTKLDEMRSKAEQTGVKGSNAMKNLASGLSKVGTVIGGAIGKLKGLWSGLSKTGRNADGLTKSFSKMIDRIKRLAVAVLVFNLLRSALKDFRDYLGLALKENQAFANAFAQVKGNLATAFQPILQAIIPALTILVEWLATATAYLATFTSLLFGKTVKASQNAAKSMSKLGTATKGTGKEAKNVLATFDEINQLAQDTASAADSAGPGGTIEPVFGETEVDTSWIDEFVSRLKSITPDLEYFYGLGERLGQKINEGLAKIDWVKIQTWATTYAQELAAFLNGAVAGIDWSLIGSTLGNGINTILTFAYNFLTTFNWLAWGIAIATGLNSMITTIDWALLGATLAAWIMSMFDTAYGFVTNFDWVNFGLTIGTGINSFFGNINWVTIGQTISTGILGALSTIGAAIAEVDWAKIGEDIKTFFLSINWVGIVVAIFDILGKALSGLSNMLPYLFDTAEGILQGIIDGIVESLPMLAPAVVGILWQFSTLFMQKMPELLQMGLDIIVALTQGLLNAIPVIVKALPEVITAAINFFIGAIPQIIDTGLRLLVALVEALPEIISAIVEAIPEIILGITNALADNSPKIIQAGIDLFVALITNLPKIIHEIINAIPKIIVAIVSSFIQAVPQMAETGLNLIKGLWNGIHDAREWLWNKIKEFFNGVVDRIKNFFGIHSPSTLFRDEIGAQLGEGVAVGLENKTDRIVGIAEGISEKIQETFEEIIIDPQVDYAEEMNKAALEGNLKLAAELEQMRNAKITELGLDYELTDVYSNMLPKEEFEELAVATETGLTTLSDDLGILSGITDVKLNDTKSEIKSGFSGLVAISQNFISIVQNCFKSLSEITKQGFNMVSEKFSNIWWKLHEVQIACENIRINIVNNYYSDGGSSSEIDIPRFATGAVIPPNKEFLAVLGDQRQGTNIEAPLDTIKQALTEVMEEQGGAGAMEIIVRFEGTSGELVRLLKPQFEAEDRRTGRRISNRVVFA